MSFRGLGKHVKNGCLKISTWWHDGEEWLTFGVLWNFFPMIIVPVLIVIDKIESPFTTLAGTYTMGIFSVSLGILNSAIKYRKHYSLAIFSLALSVFLYGTIFSDPVSPKTESGINVIFFVQIICLAILTLLLIRMAFVGVKFARKLSSAKGSDGEKNPPKEQMLEQEHQSDQDVKQGQEEKQEQKSNQTPREKLEPEQRKQSAQSKGKNGVKTGRKKRGRARNENNN